MNKLLALGFILGALVNATPAQALEQILHPWVNDRSLGMGGVTVTTGLYDEVFYGNPARINANPKWRLELPLVLDLYAEMNSKIVGNLTSIFSGLSSTNPLAGFTSIAGSNSHFRIQMPLLPNIYFGGGTHAWAVGIMLLGFSLQGDIDLRQNFSLSPQLITDLGTAVTFGYSVLAEKALKFGATAHFNYRLATPASVSLYSVLSGTTTLSSLGGDGTGADFDLGVAYDLPFHPLGFIFEFGAKCGNILGGNYAIGNVFSVTHNAPTPQPRSLGFGFSATKPSWWKFSDTIFALDFNDILNNGSVQNGVFVNDGSFFRTVHLGAETHFGVLVVRAGLNQGYPTAGIGIDTRVFSLDALTYGEEMGLTTGSLEDRRFGLRWALHLQPAS